MPSWTVVCSQTLPEDVSVVSKTTHICPFRVRFGKSDPKNLAWKTSMTTSMSRLHCYQIFAKPIGSHPCFVKTFCFFDRIWNAFRFSNTGGISMNYQPILNAFCCKGKFSQNWPYLCIPLHWNDAPKMGNLMTPETCQDLGIKFCCDSGTGSSGRWRTVGVPSTKPPESRQMFRRFTTQTQAFLLLMEEILHQLIWRSYHYLQGFGFTYLRWCRISSINSIKADPYWQPFAEVFEKKLLNKIKIAHKSFKQCRCVLPFYKKVSIILSTWILQSGLKFEPSKKTIKNGPPFWGWKNHTQTEALGMYPPGN